MEREAKRAPASFDAWGSFFRKSNLPHLSGAAGRFRRAPPSAATSEPSPAKGTGRPRRSGGAVPPGAFPARRPRPPPPLLRPGEPAAQGGRPAALPQPRPASALPSGRFPPQKPLSRPAPQKKPRSAPGPRAPGRPAAAPCRRYSSICFCRPLYSSPNAAPPRISTAPASCSGESRSPRNSAEKSSALTGSM